MTSDDAYIETSIRAVKEIDPNIFVLAAAGISSGADVYRVIRGALKQRGLPAALRWQKIARR
jgi:triosephosphate isomerase